MLIHHPQDGFKGTDRFQLLRRLGEGGMGLVFEALDTETSQHVALKVLRIMSPDFLARFKAEFREFQSRSHPNLVSLGELHQHEGHWFFTMELVEGSSFLEYARDLAPRLGKNDPTLLAPVVPVTAGPVNPNIVPGRLHEARLRAALAELTNGLEALHSSDKIHRDLKPQNVRVTPQGRVVIIDFGLAVDAAAGAESDIVGTVAYMSPEQAAARPVTPASDWYSVGVMLFEAITGQIPFSGSVNDVLLAKQTKVPPPVLELAPECPADLARLTETLLRHAPSSRPGAVEVRRVLEVTSDAQSSPSQPMPSGASTFVGRVSECERLMALARQARTEGTRVAAVVGESGLGKTSLTRQICRSIVSEDPSAWVLEGACYEREATPYKGIDAAIDMLAARLERLPRVEIGALVPPAVSLLSEFFPVLRRVPAFASAYRAPTEEKDRQSLRAELFRGLRDLFSRVAQHHPLVLVLDDVQWADADTWGALEAIMRPPDAPRLLLLLTLRADAGEHEEWHGRLGHQLGQVEWLPLERMSVAESEQLARSVADRLGTTAEVAAIANEARGNPLFIDALVRLGQRDGELSLDEALWERAQRLSPEARRVLAVVALSNGPLSQDVVCRSAELDFGTFTRHVGALRVQRLVHSGGFRGSDPIRTHHDRVRTAVRSKMPQEEQRKVHERTALALEMMRGDEHLEALAWHAEHAGQLQRAALAAEAAGDVAMKRLAFDRAALLFRSALTHAPTAEKATAALNAKLGDALTQAGRGAEAAEALRKAAAASPPSVALELKRRAADQLLRSGRIREGLTAIEEVLAIVDERIPRTPQRALARLLWSRARLGVRGLAFKPQPVEQLSPMQLMRVDATYSVAQSLSTVDLIKGAEMQSRSLLLALGLGETQRVARGLLYEAALQSTAGRKAEAAATALWQRADEMAAKIDDPNLHGIAFLARGVIAFQNAHWRAAGAAFERALDLFTRQGSAAHWEISSTRIFLLSTWFYLGRFDRWLPEIPRLLRECAERGDVYASTNLRMTHFCGFWLAGDKSQEALAQVDAAMAEWAPEGYLSQHYYALVANVSSLLYRGEVQQAFALMEREWVTFQGSLHPRVQFVRIEANHLRGRVAMAAGDLGVVDACVRALDKERTPFANIFAGLLRAVRLKQQGSAREAEEALSTAAQVCRDEDLGVYGQAAAWRLSQWRGEPEAQHIEQALAAQGFVRPGRYLGLHVPVAGG